MSLDAGRARLFTSYKALGERWSEVQLHWHDVVQQEFSRRQWDQLEPCVVRVLGAIDRLSQIMTQARQECS